MSDNNPGGGGGGFGFGFFLGLLVGAAGAIYLANGPAREQLAELRQRAVELGGTAREAAVDPQGPVRRAIADGVAAARRRRQELEQAAAAFNASATGSGSRAPGGEIRRTGSDA